VAYVIAKPVPIKGNQGRLLKNARNQKSLFKKGKKENPGNYSLVKVISVSEKLLEQIKPFKPGNMLRTRRY